MSTLPTIEFVDDLPPSRQRPYQVRGWVGYVVGRLEAHPGKWAKVTLPHLTKVNTASVKKTVKTMGVPVEVAEREHILYMRWLL